MDFCLADMQQDTMRETAKQAVFRITVLIFSIAESFDCPHRVESATIISVHNTISHAKWGFILLAASLFMG
jgi:hypothetical protein